MTRGVIPQPAARITELYSSPHGSSVGERWTDVLGATQKLFSSKTGSMAQHGGGVSAVTETFLSLQHDHAGGV